MLQRRVVVGVVVALLSCSQTPVSGPSRPVATTPEPTPIGAVAGPARLHAQPQRDVSQRLEPGLQPLGLGARRDGVIYVPRDVRGPAPLIVMFHGSGGEARRSIRWWLDHADAHGLVLLAVDSRAHTWDVVVGGFGPDVAFVDRALQHVFGSMEVDPDRVAVLGFSDGASYALSLGLSNEDLFTAVVAFSPGIVVAEQPEAQPRVFLSHGRSDPVLPIAATSHRIVRRLRSQGVDLRYEEFRGGHNVPDKIVERAVSWLLDGWELTARGTRAPR